MVSINARSLRELTGVSVDTPFECDTFGAAQSERPATLGYLDTERFAAALNANPNVTTVFTTEALAPRLVGKVVVVCEEPRYLFYRFQNQVGEANYVTRPSVVSRLPVARTGGAERPPPEIWHRMPLDTQCLDARFSAPRS